MGRQALTGGCPRCRKAFGCFRTIFGDPTCCFAIRDYLFPFPVIFRKYVGTVLTPSGSRRSSRSPPPRGAEEGRREGGPSLGAAEGGRLVGARSAERFAESRVSWRRSVASWGEGCARAGFRKHTKPHMNTARSTAIASKPKIVGRTRG